MSARSSTWRRALGIMRSAASTTAGSSTADVRGLLEVVERLLGLAATRSHEPQVQVGTATIRAVRHVLHGRLEGFLRLSQAVGVQVAETEHVPGRAGGMEREGLLARFDHLVVATESNEYARQPHPCRSPVGIGVQGHAEGLDRLFGFISCVVQHGTREPRASRVGTPFGVAQIVEDRLGPREVSRGRESLGER